LSGHPPSSSWRVVPSGKSAQPRPFHRFIAVAPPLAYSAMEPASSRPDATVSTAQDLRPDPPQPARARPTGPLPTQDDQVATRRESAPLTAVVSIGSVLVILWLALRSARIILPVAINLAVGLAISAAFGLLVVGALNVISVAFFVLFVGLGVDFGLQF